MPPSPDLLALFDVVHGPSPARTSEGRFGTPRITEKGYRVGCKPGNHGKRYPAEPLTPDETMRVLAACGGGKTGIRNRALLIVLWRSGVRISECLALRPHHIDFEAHSVTVLCGKGSKRRTSGIDEWALEQLQDWYVARGKLNITGDAPLFCCVSRGSEGNRIHPAQIRALCHRLGKQAGVSKRVHPHGFRHGHACDLVREGTSVHIISRQLGHTNLAVTANYLVGIAPEEVVRAVAARPAPLEAPVVATPAARPNVSLRSWKEGTARV